MQDEIKEIVKLQPKWKAEPSFDDLNNDRLQALEAQEVHKAKLAEYAETREGGAIPDVDPTKSKHRPKIVRKYQEWEYAALEDPFLSSNKMFRTSGRTGEDAEAARQNEILLNYQWEVLIDKQKLIESCVRDDVDNGTVITKTLWDAEYGVKIVEKEQPVYASPEESLQMMQAAVASGQMTQEQAQAMMEVGQPMQKGTEKIYVEEETLIKNQPRYEVKNTALIYIDPTCEGVIQDAMFVIEEFNVSYAELKKNEYVKEEVEVTIEVDGKKVVKKEIRESGYYKNLDKIDFDSDDYDIDDEMTDERASFKFKDKARKEVRAYEYWGYWDVNDDGVLVPIVATWIGKTLIRLEENPFPHKRIPYSIATYMPVKREIHGEPDAALLKDNQDVIAKQTRAAIDITATTAVGQEFISQDLFPNAVERNNYEKGKKQIYVRPGIDPQRAIYKQTVTPVPPTIFNMIEAHTREAEALSGTRPFNASNGSLNSATEARGALDATAKRETGVLRRLAAMFKDMARMTIANNQAFMPEEQIVRITNDYVKIRRDDLAGEIDIKLEISTPEKDQALAQDLAFMLQTGQQTLPFGITQKIWAKIARLKNLEDLAMDIEAEEPPKPSETQIQLEQMQLENARLMNEKLKMEMIQMATINEERYSRMQENLQADIAKKIADADRSKAMADKYRAETDLLDKKFVDEEGRDVEFEKELDHSRKMELEQTKAMLKQNKGQ